MQASKIIPGLIYAIVRHNKADDTRDLLRFRVAEVNTITKRRTANRSPHDSRSEVVGVYLDGENAPRQATIDPDHLAGEYKEFAELVERKAKEDAEQKAKQDADAKQAEADRLALYAFVGVTAPAKVAEYSQLFRAHWGKVDVSSDGVRAIIDRVNTLVK